MMQLKKAIEDIVRSIPAEESQKNKYRLELYAHLHELYEEERPHHSDESAAFRVALNRLGKPESLRAEFLKSLSPLSRWMGRLDFAFTWQPGESIWRHVFRAGGTCAAFYFIAVYVFLIPLCVVLNDTPADKLIDKLIGPAFLGIIIGLNLPLFLIMVAVLQVQTRKILGLDVAIRIKCLYMAGISVSSALVIWGFTLGLIHILLALLVNFLGEAHAAVTMLEHERAAVLVPWWCPVETAVVVLLPPLYAFSRRLYIPGWPYEE